MRYFIWRKPGQDIWDQEKATKHETLEAALQNQVDGAKLMRIIKGVGLSWSGSYVSLGLIDDDLREKRISDSQAKLERKIYGQAQSTAQRADEEQIAA